jgi:hypothetical protein
VEDGGQPRAGQTLALHRWRWATRMVRRQRTICKLAEEVCNTREHLESNEKELSLRQDLADACQSRPDVALLALRDGPASLDELPSRVYELLLEQLVFEPTPFGTLPNDVDDWVAPCLLIWPVPGSVGTSVPFLPPMPHESFLSYINRVRSEHQYIQSQCNGWLAFWSPLLTETMSGIEGILRGQCDLLKSGSESDVMRHMRITSFCLTLRASSMGSMEYSGLPNNLPLTPPRSSTWKGLIRPWYVELSATEGARDGMESTWVAPVWGLLYEWIKTGGLHGVGENYSSVHLLASILVSLEYRMSVGVQPLLKLFHRNQGLRPRLRRRRGGQDFETNQRPPFCSGYTRDGEPGPPRGISERGHGWPHPAH